MFSWLCNKLPARGTRKSRSRSVRPRLEVLETRLVPTINTDYTALAQSFSRHDGPTNLYLNFDGWRDNGVSSFQSANREQDIQDILYRTSEIFAPFDVRVLRFYGDGGHVEDFGESTIFIG